MKDVFDNHKILYHGDRLREYLIDGKTIPITVSIDLTNRCNNNCPHCISLLKNNDEIPFKDAKRIFKEIKDYGVRGVIITGGGEPLLYKRLPDLIEYGNELGLDIGLVTSGQTPNYSVNFHKMLENLIWIRVSLDAGSPKRYKDTHGLDEHKFIQVIDFIQEICKIKKQNELKTTIGIGYLVNLWDTEKERIDIDKAVRLCSNDSLDYFQLRPVIDREDTTDFRYVDYLEKTKMDIGVMFPNIKLYNTSMTRQFERNYTYCHAGHLLTTIAANGKIYWCCLLKNNPKGEIGDLYKKSFRDTLEDRLDGVGSQIYTNKCPKRCKNNVLNNYIENIMRDFGNEHKNFL